MGRMQRVVILGPGGAARLSELTALPVIELDRLFWPPGLSATAPGEWADFWLWLLTSRRRSRPLVRHAIAAHGGGAAVHMLPTPRAVRRFIDGLKKGHGVFGCGPPRHRHKTRGQPKASQSPARARPLQGVRPPSAR